ncbi:DUF5133 domain-containing protein [Streptomyces virginiae]|uniref:DUF5133 domain-containing protein n=1 Tax=Streptomyces virginiae TaxID=1961 RepID=A0ABZ1TP20_STRVG|nr:DUF5133 domain-containing protein [Streptomyces virginiae]
MSPAGNRPPRPTAAVIDSDTPAGPPAAAPTARAVGMLMAATPCGARDAHRILAAAASLVRTTPDAVAAAVVEGSYGTPVPLHVERAVRRAMKAARTSGRPAGSLVGILPARTRVEEVLTRLRGCRTRLGVTPEDPAALRAMDDAAYTLCVLMGRPTVHEAVLAAEAHLAHLAP